MSGKRRHIRVARAIRRYGAELPPWLSLRLRAAVRDGDARAEARRAAPSEPDQDEDEDTCQECGGVGWLVDDVDGQEEACPYCDARGTVPRG